MGTPSHGISPTDRSGGRRLPEQTFGEDDDDVEDLWVCCAWLNGGADGGGGSGSSSTESRGCWDPDRLVDEEEDLRGSYTFVSSSLIINNGWKMTK